MFLIDYLDILFYNILRILQTKGRGIKPMIITLEIPPEFEAHLRKEAQKADLDTDEYIINMLREHLQKDQDQTPYLSSTESELLGKINLGLSPESWQRYRKLIDKCLAETLTNAEQAELIQLSDQIEKANAKRMEHLVELARLRGKSLQEVMKDLGIESKLYV